MLFSFIYFFKYQFFVFVQHLPHVILHPKYFTQIQHYLLQRETLSYLNYILFYCQLKKYMFILNRSVLACIEILFQNEFYIVQIYTVIKPIRLTFPNMSSRNTSKNGLWAPLLTYLWLGSLNKLSSVHALNSVLHFSARETVVVDHCAGFICWNQQRYIFFKYLDIILFVLD